MPTARILDPPGPLRSEWRASGRRVLLRPLHVDLGEPLPIDHTGFMGFVLSPEGTTRVRVPRDFDHDGSSIPPSAGVLMGDEDNYEVAGVCHDYAYRVQLPRRLADRVWWVVARSGWKRVSAFQGWIGWAALRVAGWRAYRRYGE